MVRAGNSEVSGFQETQDLYGYFINRNQKGDFLCIVDIAGKRF